MTPLDQFEPALRVSPIAALPVDASSLVDRTMQALRCYFDDNDHRPSIGHWAALRDIARTLEAMADGACESKVFLSSVDPGVGKTQTVLHFARALIASPMHRSVGMIVCVGRISEAVAFAEALSDHRQHVAVLTSDDDANARSGSPPDLAQILVTTQQRIERSTDGRTFDGASALHYLGLPRRVRVWDEAWLPGHTVTVTGDDLLLLPKIIRPFSSDFAQSLTRFAASLSALTDGAAVDVPDFEVEHGISPYDLLTAADERSGRYRDGQQIAATALLTLNGRTARMRRDGRFGAAMLNYRDTLPPDLLPLGRAGCIGPRADDLCRY